MKKLWAWLTAGHRARKARELEYLAAIAACLRKG